MRNIYDIIAEQKFMIDMNIASYDLQYTTEHFMQNQELYYIEEGLGETIKNIGRKVVEFIKSIIRKIKELVNKVIGFFKKTDDEAEALEKQIKDAANSIGSKGVNVAKKAEEEKKAADEKKDDKKSEGKEEPKKSEKEPEEEKEEPTKGQLKAEEVKAKLKQRSQEKNDNKDTIREIENRSLGRQVASDHQMKRQFAKGDELRAKRDRKLKAGLQADEIMRNKKEREIKNRTTDFGGGMKISGLEDVLKNSTTKIKVPNFPNLSKLAGKVYYVFEDIEDEVGKNFKNDDYKVSNLNDFITNETDYNKVLDELSFETIETTVSKIHLKIYNYVKKGMHEVNDLKHLEKEMEDNLNKLIKQVEASKEFNERAEALVTRAANAIGTLANRTITAIGQIRSICISIARRETNAFCSAIKQQN